METGGWDIMIIFCPLFILIKNWYKRNNGKKNVTPLYPNHPILLTKITAAQNEAALSYDKVRGLYFLAVIFAAHIIII